MRAYNPRRKGSGDGSVVMKPRKPLDETWGRKSVVVKPNKDSALRELQRKLKESRTAEIITGNPPYRRFPKQRFGGRACARI